MNASVAHPLLALEFQSEALDCRTWRRALLEFDRLLVATSRVALDVDASLAWDMRIESGSQVIIPAARATNGKQLENGIAEYLRNELKQFQSGRVAMHRLSDHILIPLYRLSKLGAKVPGRLRCIDQLQQLDADFQRSIQAELRVTHSDFGSITGRLETLSVHGKAPNARVYDAVHRLEVLCVLSEEQLEEARLKLFGERVEVEGVIAYRRSGLPRQIIVRRMRCLRNESELPDFRGLRGILKGYQ